MAKYLQLQGKQAALREFASGVMHKVVQRWDLRSGKTQMQLVLTL